VVGEVARRIARTSHTLLGRTGVDLSAGAASASRSQPSAEHSTTSLRDCTPTPAQFVGSAAKTDDGVGTDGS